MKKKNLKNLRLTKSTISHFNMQSILGGTDAIIDGIRTIDANVSIGTCSKYMSCDSEAACPPTVMKTQLKNDDTTPGSVCAHKGVIGIDM